jgi:hypothetical protein
VSTPWRQNTRSRDITPLILNLGTRWRWMVNVRVRLVDQWRKKPGTHWMWGWISPRNGLDGFLRGENFFPQPEFEPRTGESVSSRYTNYGISSPLPKFKIIYKHRYLKTVCDTWNSSSTFGTTSLHTNFTSFFLTNCPLTVRFRSTQRLAWPIYSQLNYSGRGMGILSKYMSC